MDSPAFAVNGMFTTAKIGSSSFAKNNVTSAKPTRSHASVTMAVDAFQRKYQSIGKINVDYSRPKKLATYKRSGYSGGFLDYPTQTSSAGHYSLTNCGKQSGSDKILMKFDEYCAKGMMQVFKRSAVPYGYYTSKCTEGSVKQAAFDKRVFNRTQAFRQSQKPVNVRLNEQYETRRVAFIYANNCSREEDQFKCMPMSAATYCAGRAEALGTCYRTVTPGSTAEDYMADSVRSQLTKKKLGSGVSRSCYDGFASGDADEARVVALASEYRTAQLSASALTAAQYESARTARKLYASSCHHEETQIYQYPAVAAAMCRH